MCIYADFAERTHRHKIENLVAKFQKFQLYTENYKNFFFIIKKYFIDLKMNIYY